jgi:hypothetical protein
LTIANPEGVLGHPILVLHVSVSGPENAVITFATMRSFKDDGPDETHPLFWDRYLKIAMANSQVGAKLNGTSSGKAARGGSGSRSAVSGKLLSFTRGSLTISPKQHHPLTRTFSTSKRSGGKAA